MLTDLKELTSFQYKSYYLFWMSLFFKIYNLSISIMVDHAVILLCLVLTCIPSTLFTLVLADGICDERTFIHARCPHF